MLAIRLGRKCFTKGKRLLLKSGVLTNCKKISYLNSMSSMIFNRRNFHTSPKCRWQAPEDLSTPDLRKECERRAISQNGNRNELILRLTDFINDKGGYDSGLTIDSSLVLKKREIETELNKIPDKHYAVTYLYVEDRYQKKIASQFEDERISFHNGQSSHIKFEGKYADICHLRSQVSSSISELSSRETIYSLPQSIVLRLKRSILADIRRTHDVSFNIMRHKHNGEDMMLLAVEGDTIQRMNACDSLEEVINQIKSHGSEIGSLESFSKKSSSSTSSNSNNIELQQQQQEEKKSLKSKNDDTLSHPSLIRESVSDMYNIFQGVILYMDPRMREMMHDYQGRLDNIGMETNTNIYLGNRDLFWLNDFQLAVEGSPQDVQNARLQIDSLMNQLKSLTMTLVLPPSINNDMVKESKQLALSIQKQLGVDTVIIQQNDYIYVHLIGTSNQINNASCIIDSRVHRLLKLRGGDSERLKRRERIRTLNFTDYGVGGLDDTLRDMLRRTFESRLISPRLKKELDLQHVKGVLLYGKPGTGKTLIARKISQILGCNQPKIVNGPEVESKWVGEAEKNIRTLFEEAQQEFEEKGDDSQLHVVIFDEIDAIAKKRGGAHAKSRDGALNQLLCCMDGVQGIDNVIVFGLTNRKDCLDPALLRPGRLEVQLEIGLPDIKGREEILNIHTKKMREYGRLDENVDTKTLAKFCEGFSGADIAGMVRSAVSYALDNIDDEENVVITQDMLQQGLDEVRFALERLPSDVEPENETTGLLQA